jgi:hypothetical protein
MNSAPTPRAVSHIIELTVFDREYAAELRGGGCLTAAPELLQSRLFPAMGPSVTVGLIVCKPHGAAWGKPVAVTVAPASGNVRRGRVRLVRISNRVFLGNAEASPCLGLRFGLSVRAQDSDFGRIVTPFSPASLARGVMVAHLILVQRVEVQIFAGQFPPTRVGTMIRGDSQHWCSGQ